MNNEDLRIMFRGRVEAVTEDSVTIKPEGDLTIIAALFLGGGPFLRRVYVQDNTQPPRKFVFDDVLRVYSGLPRKQKEGVIAVGVYLAHKIGDVKVGDLVQLGCRELQGVDYCIEINRWPGGRVPPAYLDHTTDAKYRRDNQRNAEQFVEEHVIPMIPWFLGLQPSR